MYSTLCSEYILSLLELLKKTSYFPTLFKLSKSKIMKMNKLKLAAAIVGFGILGVTMSQAAFPIHEKARQETTSATNANGNNEQLSQADAQYSSASATSQSAPAAPKSHGGKSQLVALLLVIFLGGLGIHRFYLGYTWQGVVQLLTAGGCGVWALIDLIRIITGDLGPKNGKYSDTL